MITKHAVVDQIEIARSGAVQVRIALELVEDGVVLSQKWHRTCLEPGGDVDAQMATVNSHLEQMGELPVSAADIAKIRSHQF